MSVVAKRNFAVTIAGLILMSTAGALGLKVGGYDTHWVSVLCPILVPATLWGLVDGPRKLWRMIVPRRVAIGKPWAEVYRRITPPSVSILNYTIDDDDHTV